MQSKYASLCLAFKALTGRHNKRKEFRKWPETCQSKYIIVRSAMEAIDQIPKYIL